MAELKASRKSRRSKGEEEEGFGSLGMPGVPQNNQILADGQNRIQVATQPQVVEQASPLTGSGGGGRGPRLEELQRFLNQNPHLQSLYNGQISMQDMSEMELRRLEQRLKQHAKLDSAMPSPPPREAAPSVEISRSAYQSFGAEGSLMPQGVNMPQGLLTTIGFTGPQGLLAPRSVGSPGRQAPPPQSSKPEPSSGTSQSKPTSASAAAEQAELKAKPEVNQNTAFEQASYNGLHYDSDGHFQAVQIENPLMGKGQSPFLQLFSRILSSVGSLFGINSGGKMLYGGSPGSAPIVDRSSRKGG